MAPGATDMRKGFPGLCGAVESVLLQDPLSGHVFAFCNRRRNIIKLLCWDGSGLWLAAKRLERGTFSWPAPEEGEEEIVLEAEELALILGGIDPLTAPRRKWWRRSVSKPSS
jgi:transposase